MLGQKCLILPQEFFCIAQYYVIFDDLCVMISRFVPLTQYYGDQLKTVGIGAAQNTYGEE